MLADLESILAPLIFTAVAIFTRLWKIGISDIVTWDEAQYVILVALCLADMLEWNEFTDL